MRFKQYFLACTILSLCIHVLSMGAEAERSFSEKDNGFPLISTPFPIWTVDRPWQWTSTEADGFHCPPERSLRPTEAPAVRLLTGENATAVSLYLDNDYSAADAIAIVGGLQNTGASTLNEIVVRFYLGHPQNGGIQLGKDREFGSLAPGHTVYASVSWGGYNGLSKIYFVVDALEDIDEIDETDNMDSLAVGMVDQVPWVWQEINGYCHYASQTMLFNFQGADNTVYQTLELACCPHSVAYQDDWLALYSGWILSQGIGDIEFAGQIRNLNTDLVIKPTWTSYLSELRQRIDAGQPCETSVDPFWLPQPDYDLLRAYGLHSGHGVVIVGYTDDAIIINDPGVGLDLLEEPAIPHPENRGANVVVDEATFRNAVEWTQGSRYLLLSYTPSGPMPAADEMLTPAVNRSLWRLGGDAGTFEPVFWQIFDIYGRDCFPSLRDDATLETFQEVFADVMSQAGGNLADAVNAMAADCDLWGCGICWNAAAVFYGTQSYPQASRLSDLSAQLSAKGDETWEEYVDLLEAVYNNGGNTSIAGPYLSQMQSILGEIGPLEDSVLVQLNGLYGFLTEAEAGDVSGRLPTETALACYPNPFNGRAVIRYTLQEDGPVHLAVYNILGQKVRHLADGHQQAGVHQTTWDGRDDNGDEAASGIYFCRMEQAVAVQMVKMVLLR